MLWWAAGRELNPPQRVSPREGYLGAPPPTRTQIPQCLPGDTFSLLGGAGLPSASLFHSGHTLPPLAPGGPRGGVWMPAGRLSSPTEVGKPSRDGTRPPAGCPGPGPWQDAQPQPFAPLQVTRGPCQAYCFPEGWPLAFPRAVSETGSSYTYSVLLKLRRTLVHVLELR